MRSRQMRRFESAMGRLNLPGKVSAGKSALFQLRATSFHLSKLAALLILAGVIAAAVAIHTQDEYYIYAEDVHFENIAYLDAPSLIAQLGVEGWNILWIEPETLRGRLLNHAGIIDARVRLQLPGTVEIDVVERRPVAIWITNQGVYRLADNGIALSGPIDAATVSTSALDMALPQIVDPLQEAQRPGIVDTPTIDPEVLAGALAMLQTLPELQNRVRFNRSVGFNFPLPDGDGWVYWGDGLHVEEKSVNLAAIRQYIAENQVESRIVDVRFVNRPYLR